jgi:hypothetical protein
MELRIEVRKGTQHSTYLLLTVSNRLIHPIGGRALCCLAD